MERVIRSKSGSGSFAHSAKMSLSRSASTVTLAAAVRTALPCSAVVIQRWDSLFSERRFWCAILTRPRRVQIRPPTRPRQAIAGIESQHGVQQHAPAVSLADLAKSAPAFRRGAKIALAGILDCQHVPARGCRRSLIAPAFDQAIDRHLGICQKPSKTNLLRPPPPRQSPQADARTHHHASEQRRPLLSRRRSPNRPNDKLLNDIATLRLDQSVGHIIIRLSAKGIPKLRPESFCRTKTCASPSVFGEGRGGASPAAQRVWKHPTRPRFARPPSPTTG